MQVPARDRLIERFLEARLHNMDFPGAQGRNHLFRYIESPDLKACPCQRNRGRQTDITKPHYGNFFHDLQLPFEQNLFYRAANRSPAARKFQITQTVYHKKAKEKRCFRKKRRNGNSWNKTGFRVPYFCCNLPKVLLSGTCMTGLEQPGAVPVGSPARTTLQIRFVIPKRGRWGT